MTNPSLLSRSKKNALGILKPQKAICRYQPKIRRRLGVLLIVASVVTLLLFGILESGEASNPNSIDVNLGGANVEQKDDDEQALAATPASSLQATPTPLLQATPTPLLKDKKLELETRKLEQELSYDWLEILNVFGSSAVVLSIAVTLFLGLAQLREASKKRIEERLAATVDALSSDNPNARASAAGNLRLFLKDKSHRSSVITILVNALTTEELFAVRHAIMQTILITKDPEYTASALDKARKVLEGEISLIQQSQELDDKEFERSQTLKRNLVELARLSAIISNVFIDLAGANLSGLTLDGKELEHAVLEKANLKGARLRGAKLNNAKLDGADLRGVDLSGAVLDDATFLGAVFDSETRLNNAKLRRANLREVRFQDADLRGADLSHAILRGAQLKGSDLERADLSSVMAERTSFRNASLKRAYLGGAKLYRSQFGNADVSKSILTNADLRAADFSGATVDEANFLGAEMDAQTRFDLEALEHGIFNQAQRDQIIAGLATEGELRDAAIHARTGEASPRPVSEFDSSPAAIPTTVRQQVLQVALKDAPPGEALEIVLDHYARLKNLTLECTYFSSEMLSHMVLNPEPRSFDIVMVDDPWLPRLVQEDTLLDLRPFFYETHSPVPWPGKDGPFVPECIKLCLEPYGERDATLYALPFVGNVQLLFYQEQLLSKYHLSPPTSWQEVLEIGRKIDAEEPARYGYAIRGGTGEAVTVNFIPILWAHGGAILTDEGPSIDSPQAIRALKFFLDLYEICPPGSIAYDNEEMTQILLDRKVAMNINWPAWYFKFIGSKSKAKGPMSITSVPKALDRSAQAFGGGATGTWLVAIPQKANSPKLAFELIQWATGPKGMRIAATEKNSPPTRIDLLQDPHLIARFPYYPVLLKALRESRPRPRTTKWIEIENVLGDELSNAISGQAKPWEALSNAQQRLRAIFEKR